MALSLTKKLRRGTEDITAAGLVLEATQDIAISGNVFSGLTTKAVTLIGDSRGIVFANNVLSEVDSDINQASPSP